MPPPSPPRDPSSHDDRQERVGKASEAFERVRQETGREQQLGPTKLHNLLEAGEDGALGEACAALDEAVTACCGFPPGAWRDEGKTLELLLALNHQLAPR